MLSNELLVYFVIRVHMLFILVLVLSQIESKSGTLILRWVNGQLERIETWVKRAAEQEVTLFDSSYFFTKLLLSQYVWFIYIQHPLSYHDMNDLK